MAIRSFQTEVSRTPDILMEVSPELEVALEGDPGEGAAVLFKLRVAVNDSMNTLRSRSKEGRALGKDGLGEKIASGMEGEPRTLGTEAMVEQERLSSARARGARGMLRGAGSRVESAKTCKSSVKRVLVEAGA